MYRGVGEPLWQWKRKRSYVHKIQILKIYGLHYFWFFCLTVLYFCTIPTQIDQIIDTLWSDREKLWKILLLSIILIIFWYKKAHFWGENYTWKYFLRNSFYHFIDTPVLSIYTKFEHDWPIYSQDILNPNQFVRQILHFEKIACKVYVKFASQKICLHAVN